MATITVRNIAESTKRRLRVRAASRGRSMEEEVRQILLAVVDGEARAPSNLAESIAAIVDPLGGIELDLPPRRPLREPPRFDD
ncbi:MAG: plasmid stabilization protein [Bauldia sp.]